MTEGWFGEYGGRFVPETLVPALDELARAGGKPRRTHPSPPSSTRSGGSTRAGRRR
jgi:tryptophan synthase beta subunit